MKNIKLFSVILILSTLSFAQSKQERKKESPPSVTQSQIVELPLYRDSQPPVLFERAVKDERGRCKVHHQPLRVALVPVVYGLLPGVSKEYYEVERTEFPNAITRYAGGCVVMGAKEAKVLQCQKCLEAKKGWERKQLGTSKPTPHSSFNRSGASLPFIRETWMLD